MFWTNSPESKIESITPDTIAELCVTLVWILFREMVFKQGISFLTW